MGETLVADLPARASKDLALPHKIISTSPLAEADGRRTVDLRVHAPDVTANWQPGQFVIVRAHETGERIPLTVVAVDCERGTVRLVVQEVGKTTADLVRLCEGDEIRDVCGPLGRPSEIDRFGTCVAVAGGYGSAAVLPIVTGLVAAGNRVIAVVGARNEDLLVLVEELDAAASEVHVATDDGSRGSRGTVLEPLLEILSTEQVDRVIAIGPMRMMQAVADTTRPAAIPTVVSLNPIMVDGTGMCGACRVHIDGEVRFACVDGPEFDAHTVDYDELAARLGTYASEERIGLEARRD